jgi:dTDP-4-dehydrorhamnose 3,5-epimerase
VQVRALKVPDTYEFSPPAFPDHRGRFVAPFQGEAFAEAVGHELTVAQVNHSVSARGVIRGMHFADVPPGQAKYVYCPAGSLIDFMVDVRVGSPTFGVWDSVRLDAEQLNAVYLAEGIGHGFVALEDGTQMIYLCSTGYNPGRERGFDPFDPEVGLPWPSDVEPVLSEKDRAAPGLSEARAAGLLPDYAECAAFYERLRSAGG